MQIHESFRLYMYDCPSTSGEIQKNRDNIYQLEKKVVLNGRVNLSNKILISNSTDIGQYFISKHIARTYMTGRYNYVVSHTTWRLHLLADADIIYVGIMAQFGDIELGQYWFR